MALTAIHRSCGREDGASSVRSPRFDVSVMGRFAVYPMAVVVAFIFPPYRAAALFCIFAMFSLLVQAVANQLNHQPVEHLTQE